MELGFNEQDKQVAAFQEEFADVDNQLSLINQTIDKLKSELADISSKSFYVGKAKKASELSNEIAEAEKEQTALKEQRKSMLHDDVDTKEMDKLVMAAFDKEITEPIREHVQAINELIQKSYEINDELSTAYRDELSKVVPYTSKAIQKSFRSLWKFPALTSRPDYEIRKIDSNCILK